MSPYYEELRKLFPKYYDGVMEIDELCKCYAKLLEILVGCVNQFIANIFLTQDASLDYIEELERVFGIVPNSSYTKSYRIAYIKSKYSDRVPYDIIRLNNTVRSILGNIIFNIVEKFSERDVVINVDGRSNPTEDLLTSLYNITRLQVPAHIGIIINLLYNTWQTIFDNYPTWQDVMSDNANWGEVMTHIFE